MSHAQGLAQTADGTKYYYEYNGTADICCTRLYLTTDELMTHWRKDNEAICKCSTPEWEKVILSSDYGYSDFLFYSMICQDCMAITGKTHNHED